MPPRGKRGGGKGGKKPPPAAVSGSGPQFGDASKSGDPWAGAKSSSNADDPWAMAPADSRPQPDVVDPWASSGVKIAPKKTDEILDDAGKPVQWSGFAAGKAQAPDAPRKQGGGGGGKKKKGGGGGDDKPKGPSGPNLLRRRVFDEKLVGMVVEFKGSFGWIKPAKPIFHPQARKHAGKIYLHKIDIEGQKLFEGMMCEFYLFEDDAGLGAEEVTAVLGLTDGAFGDFSKGKGKGKGKGSDGKGQKNGKGGGKGKGGFGSKSFNDMGFNRDKAALAGGTGAVVAPITNNFVPNIHAMDPCLQQLYQDAENSFASHQGKDRKGGKGRGRGGKGDRDGRGQSSGFGDLSSKGKRDDHGGGGKGKGNHHGGKGSLGGKNSKGGDWPQDMQQMEHMFNQMMQDNPGMQQMWQQMQMGGFDDGGYDGGYGGGYGGGFDMGGGFGSDGRDHNRQVLSM